MLMTEPPHVQRKTLFELLTDPTDDREALYRTLAESSPVYRDSSGAWMVSDYRLGRALLTHPALSSRSPLVERGLIGDEIGVLDMMLFQDGADHDAVRRVFAPLFSKTRLDALRSVLRSDLETLLARLPDSERFDLVAAIAERLPAMTICRMLGIDVAHAQELMTASRCAIRLISAAPLSPAEHRAAIQDTRRFLDALEAFIPAVTAQLRADDTASGNDDELPLTPHQLRVNVLLMFIAGYGTTMLSIGNTIARALDTPGLWTRLAAEPALVPAAVRELMRIEPAAHLLFRYARAALVEGPLALEPGDVVAIVAAAANRDATMFEAPGEVHFDRTHNGLAFGAGPHGCIGVALARMQLEIVFDTLLRRMPRLALARPQGTPGPRLQEGSFRGYSELWLLNPDAPAQK